MTNKEFAEKDQYFGLCCDFAGTVATTRQASKFRMKKGSAYNMRVTVNLYRLYCEQGDYDRAGLVLASVEK